MPVAILQLTTCSRVAVGPIGLIFIAQFTSFYILDISHLCPVVCLVWTMKLCAIAGFYNFPMAVPQIVFFVHVAVCSVSVCVA